MKLIESPVITEIILHALREDIGSGDITTDSLVPDNMFRTAMLTAKADGVIAGLEIAEYVFSQLSKDIVWKPLVKDGEHVNKGEHIVELSGSYRALLTGERLALNFLQRMSGIATATAAYVDAVRPYSTQILDTRKTVPGLRLLDKYAVKAGGGTNHRIGLYDMILIKDNHIKLAGGIKKAVSQIREKILPGVKIEVETTSFDEVNEALDAGADIIMLDNMSVTMMAECVRIINHRCKVEASGNMNLERVKEVAATGVDYISVGALTHSVIALDINMNFTSDPF